MMMKAPILSGLLVVLSCAALAQSRESANSGRRTLSVGAQFSMFNPDFYCPNSSPFSCGAGLPLIKGVGTFTDYNFRPRWGIEGAARWLHWDVFDGQTESTYLVGPRFIPFRSHGIRIWVKMLVGAGAITTAHYPGPNTFKGVLFVYAPGGGVNFRLNRRLSVRADY